MLVTTTMSAGSLTKVPSDSSDSTTIQSPVAHARIGAVGVDDAAVDDGRVEPAGVEQRRDHRGGRGLAVRAADGDRRFQPHQLGEHLGAADDRQAARPRLDQLGIVALDGGGDDDHRRVVEILRVVADRDLDAALAQPLHVGAVGDVGAAHAIVRGWPAPRRSRSCRCRRCRRNGSGRSRAAVSCNRTLRLTACAPSQRRRRRAPPDRRAARPRRRRPSPRCARFARRRASSLRPVHQRRRAGGRASVAVSSLSGISQPPPASASTRAFSAWS